MPKRWRCSQLAAGSSADALTLNESSGLLRSPHTLTNEEIPQCKKKAAAAAPGAGSDCSSGSGFACLPLCACVIKNLRHLSCRGCCCLCAKRKKSRRRKQRAAPRPVGFILLSVCACVSCNEMLKKVYLSLLLRLCCCFQKPLTTSLLLLLLSFDIEVATRLIRSSVSRKQQNDRDMVS